MKVACRREERGSGGGSIGVLQWWWQYWSFTVSLRGIVVIDRRNGKKGGGMD